jgi:competence protein ComFB
MRQLHNFTLETVTAYLNRWLKDEDICQCEDCRLDIMAIMLNRLEPRYVVSDVGAMYAQVANYDPQSRSDYMAIMTQAINIVKDNPRH